MHAQALGINFAIAAGILLAFSLLRSRPSNYLSYVPRTTKIAARYFHSAHHTVPPKRELDTGRSWLSQTISLADEDVLAKCGLDSCMYVVFQRHVLRLFLLVAVLSCCVLVPVNNTGEMNKINSLGDPKRKFEDGKLVEGRMWLRGFNDWMVSNIADESEYLWAHLLVFLLICTATYATVGQFTVDFLRLRRLYKSNMNGNEQVAASSRTVLLRNIPKSVENPEDLADRLDKMVPGKVVKVWLPRVMKELLKLRGKETEIMIKLDAAKGALKKKGERPQAKVGLPLPFNLCCGTKVDAINHWETELVEVRAKIKEQAAKDHPTTGAAFAMFETPADAKHVVQNLRFKADPTIIFKKATAGPSADGARGGGGNSNKGANVGAGGSINGAVADLPRIDANPAGSQGSADTDGTGGGGGAGSAKRALSGPEVYLEDHHDPTVWIAEMAPLPEDVIWGNLGVPESTRSLKKSIFILVTCWLVLFWAIPVGFCGSINNLAALPGVGVAFRPFLDLPPVVLGLLSTYLPVIVLIVFNALLPMILTAFSTQEGVVSISRRTSMVLVKFYAFTMFSVIIIPSVLVGGMSTIQTLIDEIQTDPIGRILDLVEAVTSPSTSMYIGLLLSSGVIGGCVLVLQAPTLILGRIARMLAVTPHQQKLALTPPYFPYHLAYAGLLLGLSITLLFCITLPITTLFGVVFVLFKSVTTKYALAFVFQTSAPSDGSMSRAAVRMLLITLAVLQVATVAMLLAKKAYIQVGIAFLFSLVSILVMGAVNGKLDAVFANDLYVGDPGKEGEAYAAREAQATGNDGGISGKLVSLIEGVGGKMLSVIPTAPLATAAGAAGAGGANAARRSDSNSTRTSVNSSRRASEIDEAATEFMESYTHPALIDPKPLREVDLTTTGDGVSLAEIFAKGDVELGDDGRPIGSGDDEEQAALVAEQA